MPRSRFRCRRLIALEFFILIKGAVRFDDRLQIELPLLTEADPNAGAALQELLGEKYGEMSPLGNYAQPSRQRAAFQIDPHSTVTVAQARELGCCLMTSCGRRAARDLSRTALLAQCWPIAGYLDNHRKCALRYRWQCEIRAMSVSA